MNQNDAHEPWYQVVAMGYTKKQEVMYSKYFNTNMKIMKS